ncbi:tail fiber protein [Phascolarctobacterium succinatutens]|uniref:phage tail protein n=1 Tax=Phascolarctobacterium succinatutens TaxID=626940 RepID=UPI003F7DCE21
MANTGQFAKVIVTAAGKDMIAKSQGGQILHFTRVSLGDGLVAPGEDPVNYTSVKNERLSVPIAKYNNLNNGQFEIQFRVSNQNVTEGFWHREIGVMAKIDNGTEELYAYTTAGNTASYIYDKTAPVDERVVNVTFVIGNALNLDVVIDNSIIYLTKKDYEQSMREHENNPEAHGNAMQTHNEDESAHTDMVGATENLNGKRGMAPAPPKGSQDLPLCGGAVYKVLPIGGGGTGATSAAAARTNLGIDVTYFNPTGSIIAFAGNTLPDGYLLCDGSKVSRTTYKKLFDVIGTTYGAGDGKTTFTLPNLIDRFLEGSSAAGSYREAGLPNIEAFYDDNIGYANADKAGWHGAVYLGNLADSNITTDRVSDGLEYCHTWKFDASKSNPVYGKSNTVQPAALSCKFCIKY